MRGYEGVRELRGGGLQGQGGLLRSRGHVQQPGLLPAAGVQAARSARGDELLREQGAADRGQDPARASAASEPLARWWVSRSKSAR